ncbi:hypothetical protein [Flavobacterium sp.]|uniref:hypothetical protein n=1 Tax=Flavobacterium sp. TaxID=239 RepID=UPI002489A5F7|nr:hypothetical protein [Flavobacterium sp.]MDI1315919.1 hypothetical protein [Flavobacterium sp.]
MPARTSGRIVIPTNPSDLLILAQKIYDKHVADGATSPLNAMSDYNWATDGPKVAPCKQNNDDAEDAAKKAEQFYRQRDVDLPQIKSIVQNSAAVLKSIYAKNPKVLGDYGLVVDDTPKAKKPK